MKISEVRKGMRVQLSDKARALLTLPIDTAIDLGRSMLHPRYVGTVRSPRPIATRPPYEEGLVVYVIWDGMPSPEAWHLPDLEAVAEGAHGSR